MLIAVEEDFLWYENFPTVKRFTLGSNGQPT